MKAVVYDSAKNFTIKEIPTPDPKAGEVLVKIELAGVCGTDLHIHEGDFLAEFPLIPGHEMVGIVSALGAGVNQFKVGERVTVNPVVSVTEVRETAAFQICPHLGSASFA